MDIYIYVTSLIIFLGQIPRCETVGQRVLYILNILVYIARTFTSLPSQNLYGITFVLLFTTKLAAKVKQKVWGVCFFSISSNCCVFSFKTLKYYKFHLKLWIMWPTP